MLSVLEIFAPANKLIQKEVTNLKLGIDLINASSKVLEAKKNSFDEFISTLGETIRKYLELKAENVLVRNDAG